MVSKYSDYLSINLDVERMISIKHDNLSMFILNCKDVINNNGTKPILQLILMNILHIFAHIPIENMLKMLKFKLLI